MPITTVIKRLGQNDLKLIGRDSFMIAMFLFVIVIGVVLRYLLPWLNSYLAAEGILPGENIQSSLADHYPVLVAYMAIFSGGLLVGSIFGFLLLGEKEDKTLVAMLVTPVPLPQYALYRVGSPVILAFVAIIALLLFIDQALPSFWQMLCIAAGGSFTAPIFSLFYAGFARNKVQGFAISKFVGLSGWFILGAWFVAEPLQWVFGIFPPYWISKAYWMALEGRSEWWLALILGILLQLGLILLLLRRFKKVAYR